MKSGSNILATFAINGSLRKREEQSPNSYTEHYLFNSAANLKAYSYDGLDFAYYGYNASNTRTYKLSMLNQNQWVNGQPQPLNLQPQSAMFYPNAYLNFNQNGEYTKHYYNGTERIASRLGDMTAYIYAEAGERLENRMMRLDALFRSQIGELVSYEEPPAPAIPADRSGGTRELVSPPVEYEPFLSIPSLQPTGTATDIFYYHTNHLGSTAYVTDNNATITQGFLYAPFGEITTEYAPLWQNGTLPKYAFNAKELDEETGMYYYEARYYKPPVFTSRDPHFESYFWTNPYGYCKNNPLKYIDPTGKDGVVIVDDETQTLTIKATYFVQTKGDSRLTYTADEIETMNTEINGFLNSQGYSVTKGHYKGYSVKFDLQFKEGGDGSEAETLLEHEKLFNIPVGNLFNKGDQTTHSVFIPQKDNSVVGGMTGNEKYITMNSSFDNLRNRIHEIFHTLFFDRDNSLKGIGSYYVKQMPNQKDINKLVNNYRLPKIKQ